MKLPRKCLYYGYILNETWLLQHAVQTHLCDNLTPEALKEAGIPEEDVDIVSSTIAASLTDIRASAEITLRSKLGVVLSRTGYPKHCIALATNDPTDFLPVPPPETYTKLKEILKTTAEPKWYWASAQIVRTDYIHTVFLLFNWMSFKGVANNTKLDEKVF